MFITAVPIKSSTETTKPTVVNKTIVYSDTVLPLKDTGNNLIVTSIDDVSESSLENCLKIIFESNPNVIFNTIQYSKNNKKVYFYTNQEITKQAYEERNYKKYEPVTSSSEILEEIKKVLVAPRNKDSDCISLFDVSMLLKNSNDTYNNIIPKYHNDFDNIVKKEIGKDSMIVVYDFDFKTKLLNIGFCENYKGFKDIFFAKENDDLYVFKSESRYSNDVLKAIGPGLSNLYDELIKYSSHEESKIDIKSVNSNFIVDIDKKNVQIVMTIWKDKVLNSFYLYKNNDNNYSLHCNSNKICETVKGNEDEIFKRIFIKISDCPKWCQTELYEIRQNQLAEEQRIEKERQAQLAEKQKMEEERQYLEAKKQKRLEFVKKIFTFPKKQK